MKILYVITLGTWGGAQSHLYSLIKDQIARNNEVSLVVGEKGDLTTKIAENLPQVKILRLKTLQRNVSVTKIISSIYRLRKIIKSENPQIVHLHSTMAGIIGRLAATNLKKPVIFTVHGWAFTEGASKKRQFFAKIVEKLLAPLTSCYLCVSKYDYNLGLKKGILKNTKAYVILNGVKDNGRDNSYPEKIKESKFIITMAARFSNQKNQLMLIRAIRNLNNKNVNLVLLGDGPNISQCKQYVSMNNMEDVVQFIGKVNDVTPYYRKSNVIALISNYEGLPVSLIEALPIGKPIIASNVGGVSELFDGNGICVENKVSLISSSIVKIMRNSDMEREMGIKSRKLYKNQFTETGMTEKINNVYIEMFKK